MLVIAIDGPVGSGKSTVAEAVAARLELEHLDSGAMYRAVALAALRRGLDVEQAPPSQMAEVAGDAIVDQDDPDLRMPAVGQVVSIVAAVPAVRAVLVQRQRDWIAAHGGGVVDGRDIGTVVFPDADVKVYLTASEDERARRRERDETAADVARRDRLDSTRAVSPLVVAEGAVVIDTTSRTVDDIVDEIVGLLGSTERQSGHR
ncbi:MAG TPA: (d)CMP kinase [Acidimicrobiales bacterium]|nr:(d)CMP kinase [Acidimicrobiales bacterium]